MSDKKQNMLKYKELIKTNKKKINNLTRKTGKGMHK